ncbi:dinitrogenase iron-molybdenum cofactor biosynthesis protein [candidate division KSB1 bacterium]|nr:MAG: dinitrogenase iron-molybdenum cofactor biosynthesis protein [candidate division KSB1 bacterium]
MIIALASEDSRGLDSILSHHFGRCPYYTFVEVEGKEIRNTISEKNPYFDAHNPGQVPAYINSKNVDVMISGGMGARAVDFFRQFGIKPVTGVTGTVKDVVQAFIEGRIDGVEPCEESKAHGH